MGELKPKKEVTIYDLAQELKLSPSTVSRALRNHHSVGKTTRNTVKQLAKDWGYRRNSMAANLRKRDSNTIGVLVSWIGQPFQARLISGVEEVAKEHGYNVIISQSRDSVSLEKENLKALFDSRVSGMVISLAMESENYEHFDFLYENETPVVFVDRTPKVGELQRVVIDNYDAGYKATLHLIEQGCKNIAHVGGAQHQDIYDGRQRGYREALISSGLSVDEKLIVHGQELNITEGIGLTKRLLDTNLPIDGIFYANDQSAASGISYLKEQGVRIPEDIAVMGFNDDPICQLIDPPLSSITHPARIMGQIAAQRVLRIKEESKLVPQTVVLGTEVVGRASSLRS